MSIVITAVLITEEVEVQFMKGIFGVMEPVTVSYLQ